MSILSILVEMALIAAVVIIGGALKAILSNLEDDAFDAELTAVANERARHLRGLGMQEMNI